MASPACSACSAYSGEQVAIESMDPTKFRFEPVSGEYMITCKACSRTFGTAGTDMPVVEFVLDQCEGILRESSVMLDLGCGDGRFLVEAAKRFGCCGIGFEIQPKVAQRAKRRVSAEGVGHLVTIETADFRSSTAALAIAKADVVVLFLLPEHLAVLGPLLLERGIRSSAVVITHQFEMPSPWKPEKHETVSYTTEDGRGDLTGEIYVYNVPSNA